LNIRSDYVGGRMTYQTFSTFLRAPMLEAKVDITKAIEGDF